MSKVAKNVLIVCPILHGLGGVSNHFYGLSKYWTFNIRYNIYGKRNSNDNKIIVFIYYVFSIIKFLFDLIFRRVDVVMVNPSFRKFQLFRDGIYVLIARLFRKKIIVFFHGWDEEYANKTISDNKHFLKVYNNVAFMYVLCSSFKKQLELIGVENPILLNTTKVKDSLLKDYEFKDKFEQSPFTILFLARMVSSKGIYETIDAFKILHTKYPKIKLIICGSGPELNNVKLLCSEFPNIEILGGIQSDKVADYYKKSSVYILPTTHGEGMATSILEAMAFGLPVISRPVGGVIDFYKEGNIIGFLTESLNPQVYADLIEKLIINKDLYTKISKNNYNYAKHNFYASKVALKIENDILKYC